MGKQLFKAAPAAKTETTVKPAATKTTKAAAPAAAKDVTKAPAKSAPVKKTAAKKATPQADGAVKRGPGRPKKERTAEEMKPKRSPGRPKGEVQTSPTVRVAMNDKKLIENGGRIINKLRLAPDVRAKLEQLRVKYGTDRAAIEAGIMALA